MFGVDEPLILTIAELQLAEPQARTLKRLLLAGMEQGRAWEWESPNAPECTISLMLVRGAVE
ncbi:hypothetical protein HLB42_21310 (plasmid) [Deinococcus sp. D7000]|nr:hypothetical protein HLB42_21310 [Deinococcus sp. D7000]